MRTCVIAIARMEGNYLPQWIEHYQALGFTNVILCDNDHDGDEEDVQAIIEPYGDFVIYEDYRNKVGCQMKAYSEMYAKYKDEFDWLAFLDVDEFLTLEDATTIDEFLEGFTEHDCILVNWMCYGDCNNIEADFTKTLEERFTYPLPIDKKVQYDFPENVHVKSIIRGGLDNVKFYGNPHVPSTPLTCSNVIGVTVAQSPFQPIIYKNAHIKHYVTKSLEEWYSNKMVRGTADRPYEVFKRHYANRFFQYNEKTQAKLDWLYERNIYCV